MNPTANNLEGATVIYRGRRYLLAYRNFLGSKCYGLRSLSDRDASAFPALKTDCRIVRKARIQ